MMSSVEERLQRAGFTLATAQPSVANYLPALISGSHLYVSGQLPFEAGKIRYNGKVGKDLSIDEGKQAAALCVLNGLAQAKLVLGDLGRIAGCVRLGGFVNCEQNFYEQPAVLNGASDLIVTALGDAGRHVRAAVGCSSLPLNAAVEVEAIFALHDRG
ncbi:MAG: RidA family protein [Rhizobiales bacterium]|jgi:enamine deaminase RidA (YjgF/YER057c/UK114 family)|nr:RidA family protein [Hyphomicrobiales bacterium]